MVTLGTGNALGLTVEDAELGNDLSMGGTFMLDPVSIHTVGQGTWGVTYNSTKRYGQQITNTTSHADGDNFTEKMWFPAGVYTIVLVVTKNNASGKVKVTVGSTVALATTDLYDAGGVNNATVTGNFTLTTSGLKDVKVEVDGKHASSSDHILYIHSLSFQRTA